MPLAAQSLHAAPADLSLKTVTVEEIRKRLGESAEGALVDVREEGVHSRDGHILLSASLPLSRIELGVAALVPRLGTPVTVYDGGDGELAGRAARRLQELGYEDVSLLAGGVAAWKAAGHETYTGVSVLSKAFGEFVEHAYGTPHLSATDVKSRIDAGEDIVVLDSRTLKEFENFSIPGAIACPSAELVYRAHDLVKSPDTLVVVNCAGRTRSIIGAQALINAGLPNKVAALENGTMAWLINGYGLDHGSANFAPKPSAEGLAQARDAAARLTKRFGVRQIDAAELAAFEADKTTRSLYFFDVRTREEFEAGHFPGTYWAEGGQLVQGVDKWVGTRNARIVLVDDAEGVRAAITASWLIQIGWGEVFVFTHGLDGGRLETGPDRAPVAGVPPKVETLSAAELKAQLERGDVTLLDLDTSLAYREGHIPGAWFAIRSRFKEGLPRLPGQGVIALASPDGVLARFAAADLAALTGRPVKVLAGGTAAWRAAGLPFESGETRLLDQTDDVWRSPYQRKGDLHAAFKEYLDWEIGLVAQLDRDESVRFRVFD